MSDLISKEELLNKVGRMQFCYEYGRAVSDIYHIIKDQPTIEAIPVVHGEWKYSPKENIATCKMCSYEHYLGTYHQYARNFCPNCGADMRKGGA